MNKTEKRQQELSKMARSAGYYVEDLKKDAKRWCKAISEGRVICNIESVSSSGMTRHMKFVACCKHKNDSLYSYQSFFSFFKAMGFSPSGSHRDTFRIGGCGMDMVFHTNYTIIHQLYRLGIITRATCNKLSQMTPTVI